MVCFRRDEREKEGRRLQTFQKQRYRRMRAGVFAPLAGESISRRLPLMTLGFPGGRRPYSGRSPPKELSPPHRSVWNGECFTRVKVPYGRVCPGCKERRSFVPLTLPLQLNYSFRQENTFIALCPPQPPPSLLPFQFD